MASDSAIDVSVVMPCLNEEKGIALCIQTITDVFKRENIQGEIIVADNGSTDNSVKKAIAGGARVVFEPRRGYGAAYLCGIRHSSGRYIIIGDSDNTYDFNDIPRFIEPLRKGYDFVIGSRFKGTIHKGAMPWAHRYIGNPVLSWMTRLFFIPGFPIYIVACAHSAVMRLRRCGFRWMAWNSPQKWSLPP